MPADNHHKANYAIGAVLAAGIAALGIHENHVQHSVSQVKSSVGAIRNTDWAPLTDEQKAALSKAVVGTPHELVIYCTSGCGEMPEDLLEAFEAGGWKVHIESAFGTSSGVLVSPDNGEGRKVAASISTAAGISVKSGDQDGGAWAIVVGRKGRK